MAKKTKLPSPGTTPDRRWYIIGHDLGTSGGPVYWNNDNGWVPNYADASTFSEQERTTRDAKSGGYWRVWRQPKAKPPAPLKSGDMLWVMYYGMANEVGSISHVSHGDMLYRTQEECQTAIDNMQSWMGMGDRKRYRPMALVLAEGI